MLTVDEVRLVLAEACRKAGSQKTWARENGVSQAYVNDILRHKREPGLAVLQGLGLERATVYDRPEAIRRLTGAKRR